MDFSLTLVDLNPRMVAAWRGVFAEAEGVRVLQGSLLAVPGDAWVNPTNARCAMDGGLDLAIKNHLGAPIQARVRRAVRTLFGEALPVGRAVCVETGRERPRYLVSTPTMHGPSENVSATLNVALACAAAFQAVRMLNEARPGAVRSVVMPGLGAGTGRVPPEVCADLMWTAWDLFSREHFEDFDHVREALEAELGANDARPVYAGPRRVVPEDLRHREVV
ncbi:MAG: macro domain-containing protein [Deltaproteobacteria bacterium]|nr:macro domain-containing protein [Deltaproteobacteria bacterium]